MSARDVDRAWLPSLIYAGLARPGAYRAPCPKCLEARLLVDVTGSNVYAAKCGCGYATRYPE